MPLDMQRHTGLPKALRLYLQMMENKHKQNETTTTKHMHGMLKKLARTLTHRMHTQQELVQQTVPPVDC